MRVLIISTTPMNPTGYGIVSKYLSQGLGEEHDVYIYAEGYQGQEMKFGKATLVPTVRPDVEFRQDSIGRIYTSINRYKPDVVIPIGDLLFYDYLVERKRNFKLVPYFPVDSDPPRYREVLMCKNLDAVVTISKWSKKVLEKYGVKDVHAIPHGYNPDIFKPMDKKVIREQLGLPSNIFLLGTVSTNVWRKNIPSLLASFKLAFSDTPDVHLLMVTPPTSRYGSDLPSLVKYLKLQNRVHFVEQLEYLALSEAELALLYNAMDVFVLASTGEGFGLPLIEAQASGVPCIGTDYSSITELLEGSGLLVKTKGGWWDVFGTWRAVVDEDAMATAMRKLYDNPDLREELSRKAIEKAKEYTWQNSNRQWLDLLSSIGDVESGKHGH